MNRLERLERQCTLAEARESGLGISTDNLRILLTAARAAGNMADAFNAKREVALCDPDPETRREVNRIFQVCKRGLFAGAAPLLEEEVEPWLA